MRRRWIADTVTPDPALGQGHPTHAALTGEQAAHLARVLRAQTGQVFDVVAAGFLHRAEITTVSAERVDFVLREELESESTLPLHVYLAVFKFDHFEWGLEKATELGVTAITPVLARRTEKHLAQAAAKRVERWRKIAHEAAQQSRRTSAPRIGDPVSLKVALVQEQVSCRLLLSETEDSLSLADALLRALRGGEASEQPSHYALAIGPEGGWAPEEMQLFTQHAWTAVTLGPRILRAETAAIAAIAIAGSVLG